MTRFRAMYVVAIGLLVGTQPLCAQDVGDRVRVTTDVGSRVIGRIVAVRSAGFDLGLSGGQSGSFARADILRMERSLGTKSAWQKGLLYGAGGGFLVGFTVAETLIYTTCEVVTLGTATEECEEEGFGVALAFSAIWGAIGGVLGMGVGALMKGPERWETIALGGGEPTLQPIFDFRLDRGHTAAVLGVSLRL